MVEAALIIIAVVFALLAGFLIPVLLELRKAARELSEFLDTTGDSLKNTLRETDETLKSIRQVTDDVNAVTEDARELSSSLADAARNVRAVGELLDTTTLRARASAAGIKAGALAALGVLIKNLFKRRHS